MKSKQTAVKILPSVNEGVVTNGIEIPSLTYGVKLAAWLARSRPTAYEDSIQEVRKHT